MRIAVGGFLHESHSFAPRPATFDDFLHPGGFPGLVQGAALLPTLRANANAIGGAIAFAEAAGATLAPLAWCIANPSGPVDDAAFERIAALICANLSEALMQAPLDGVYLDLHGAALADSFPDAEAELLRRVRAIVGPVPITTSLDPHANLTAEMADRSDALAPYLTYPHVDMPAAGARAMRLLLARIARGAPFSKAFRQIDFWMPITSQCTLNPPMLPVMQAREAIIARTGAIDLAWCFGFPYADFPGCGAALCAYAETQAAADAAADAMVAELNAREPSFALPIPDAAAAVTEAMALARAGGLAGPVIIADTQDNPGGGGHGDTTGLLAELIRQGAQGAVVCLINDKDSAAACHAAGEGAAIALSLGGKSDGAPLPIAARVLRLADGTFTLTGPMSAGNTAVLGPTALIEAAPGIRVVVVSRKMQAYDQAILRHVGIEPAATPILALKSSVHFRADFAPIARAILIAAAPGPVVADPATLTFHNLRPNLRLRPAANR
jgi:microcystin degradation protein MlrC